MMILCTDTSSSLDELGNSLWRELVVLIERANVSTCLV